MATVPPIRQTIKFEGLDEIKQKLSDLGGAGEKAFADIRAASAPAVQSMERLEGAIANVQRSMASVAVTGRQFGTSIREAGTAFNNFEQAMSRTVRSVRNYGAVLAAAVAGVALFVRSGIQAGDDIEEQAQALGLSAQAYQELGFAASESGVKQSQFASGMRVFSQKIQQATQDSAKSMLQFVESIDKNFDSLGGRIKRVTDAAVVPFSAIREAARNFQADLASKGINRSLFEIEQGFRKLAAGGAEGRAEFERLGRVSLPAARDGLDVLRDGSEKSVKALNKLLPTFKRTEDGSVDLGEAFLKVADHFKTLPDGVQKTALAMAFFGRAAGPQLIPFLNQGSAGIGDFLAKTRELGLQLSGPQIKASADAARSFDLLARSATNVKNQIGAAFAPVASTIASGFTDFLSKNQTAINAFANDLNTKATPYVQAFFDMLAGRENVTAAGEKIDQLRQRFVNFATSVRTVGTIIGNAFTIILSVLDQVAAGFNAVFGTSLTGAELGVILVITKMVGGFALLLSTLAVVGAALTVLNNGLKLIVATGGVLINVLRLVGVSLIALVGWPALIVAGLTAALVAIVVYWEQIKAGATAAFAWVVEKATFAFAFVSRLVTQGVDGAWNWLLTTLERVLNAAMQKWEAFKRAFTSSAETGGSTGAPEPFARGGHVRGPGTSTSDSIPALLSRDEFVHRAKAVRYYGTDFMAAINAMRIPKDLFRGFSMGGLADGLNRSMSALMIPRFAAGGLMKLSPAAAPIASGRPFVINMTDGRQAAGVISGKQLLDALEREAISQQSGSTGRKPTFVC